MKIKLNIYLLLIPILLFLGSCGNKDNDQAAHEHGAGETTYTCPMHPQVVAQEPGSCPICGMDLVPQTAHAEGIEVTEDLSFLLEPTNRTVVASIATTSPLMKSVETSVKMEGIITYDPRRVYNIPARVGGRIEQLYVKYNYQPISKGQKLMEIYSPELVTAQKELLYLVQSAPEDTQLIESAKQRLLLLGATQEQVNRLIRSGEASYTFALYSPYDGYVIGLNTSPPLASAGAMQPSSTPAARGMGGMAGGAGTAAPAGISTAGSAGEEIQLREGMYVAAGQALLRVVNTEQLWAEFNIPAGYVSSIAKGAPVDISFPGLPEESLEAQVDFFQPYYEAGENFARLRVYLPGEQNAAMVGQLVSGRARYTTPPSLWVPKEAVLDVGTRSVAFVKDGAAFRPVAVSTGISEGGQTQILDGLQQSDVIAGNAQFMVDSESFIRVNN
ncbi:efflux RND transporter periplasmic adaptor subunit [Cesiribacter sp. SM1]|uniref:efflux RND transporter periplasmic adaptor subunit n=1 Tax=Cesiribacter sp. SM1 TaxID=2861196 RepID=UPI001CD6980B|nr:efflux RND transporter periplasmic adaptor subunit [Cesiribacter sp. SM1]